MIEKLARPPPIKAEKKERPFCCSKIADRPSVFTPGTGITERNLYTNTKSKVAIIFFLIPSTANTDLIPLRAIKH